MKYALTLQLQHFLNRKNRSLLGFGKILNLAQALRCGKASCSAVVHECEGIIVSLRRRKPRRQRRRLLGAISTLVNEEGLATSSHAAISRFYRFFPGRFRDSYEGHSFRR